MYLKLAVSVFIYCIISLSSAETVRLIKIAGCSPGQICFVETDNSMVFCKAGQLGQCPSATECARKKLVNYCSAKSLSSDYSVEINQIIDRRNAFVEASHQRLLAIQQYEFAHRRLRGRLSEVVGIANDDKKFEDSLKGREDQIYYEQARVDLALEQVFDAKARLLYELQYVKGKLQGHDDLIAMYQKDIDVFEKQLEKIKNSLLERKKKAIEAIDKWSEWKYRMQLQGQLDLTQGAIDRITFDNQTQSYKRFLNNIETNFYATRIGTGSRSEMEALLHQYRVMATNARTYLAPMLSCRENLEKAGARDDCVAKKKTYDELIAYTELKLKEINSKFQTEILPLYMNSNKRDLDQDGSPLDRGRKDPRVQEPAPWDEMAWMRLERRERENSGDGRDHNDDRPMRHTVRPTTDQIDRVADGEVRASYPIRREDRIRSELREAHRNAIERRMDYREFDNELANLRDGITLTLEQTGDQGLVQLRDEVNRFQSDKDYYNGKVDEYSQRMREQHNGLLTFADGLTTRAFPDNSIYETPSTTNLPTADELIQYTRTLADIAVGMSPIGDAYDIANAGYAMIFDQTLLGDPVDGLDKTILAIAAMPLISGPTALAMRGIASKLLTLAKEGSSTSIRAIKAFYKNAKAWTLDILLKDGGIRQLDHLHASALELFGDVPSPEKLGSYLEMLRRTGSTQGLSTMGSATRKEADFLRDMWVGPDAIRRPYDGKPGKFIWVSKDGLKVYREPVIKRSGKVQANFEWRFTPNETWHNGHLNILD